MTIQRINPVSVAMITAALAAQKECLHSSSDIMYGGTYRKARIRELTLLALDLIREAEEQTGGPSHG